MCGTVTRFSRVWSDGVGVGSLSLEGTQFCHELPVMEVRRVSDAEQALEAREVVSGVGSCVLGTHTLPQ